MNTALLLPIAAGGALGACARYLLGGMVLRQLGGAFPYGTLMVNVLGSLLIGVIAGWFLREMAEAKPILQAFLMTGFLGGFTTFSAFSLEMITLLQRGDIGQAFAYAASSVILTLGACALGVALMR